MKGQRRASAAVMLIVVLVLLDLLVVGLVIGTARYTDLAVRRLDTVRAFYAAEGGMNMAIRELSLNSDEDGDGAIGSISDDADDNTDPEIGGTRVFVTRNEAAGVVTLVSTGRSGDASRRIESTLQ